MAFDVSSEWITPELSLIGPVITIFKWEMYGRILFTYFIYFGCGAIEVWSKIRNKRNSSDKHIELTQFLFDTCRFVYYVLHIHFQK